MAHLAKNSIIFTGRIGDITIFERSGKTHLRPRYNETPRHPKRTKAQLDFNLRLGNYINFWNLFSQKEKPQFQDRHAGVTNYNQFVAYAIQSTPIYLTHRQIRSGGCVATNVALSAGSLPSIDVAHDGTAPVTDIKLGILRILPSTTAGQLARAIVDNNIKFMPNDIILYYLCQQSWDYTISVPRVRIVSHSLVLNPYDTRPLSSIVGGCVGFADRNGHLAASQDPEGGMAWVHLRPNPLQSLQPLQPLQPLLSSQRLFCNNPYIEQFSTPEALEKAINAYKKRR